MKAESWNYDVETGEAINLSKEEIAKTYILIEKSKDYAKKIDTIIYKNGWKKSKNADYRQQSLFS